MAHEHDLALFAEYHSDMEAGDGVTGNGIDRLVELGWATKQDLTPEILASLPEDQREHYELEGYTWKTDYTKLGYEILDTTAFKKEYANFCYGAQDEYEEDSTTA